MLSQQAGKSLLDLVFSLGQLLLFEVFYIFFQ
jgi:hypothetical protein